MQAKPTNPWLDKIEQIGNRLPDPVLLFIIGTVVVIIGAEIAVLLDWTVTASSAY